MRCLVKGCKNKALARDDCCFNCRKDIKEIQNRRESLTPMGALINGRTCIDRLGNNFESIENDESFIILGECFNHLAQWIQDTAAMLDCRAGRLLVDDKPFFVVKASEPYARKVVELIKQHEGEKWTKQDEEYAERVLPTPPKKES